MTDLNTLATAGHKKITDSRSLYASDYIQLISEASLKGSDNLLELVSKVYAIGFERGYRARQYDTRKRRKHNTEVKTV